MENLLINIIELTLPISSLIVILLLLSPLIKHSYVAKWRYYMWLFIGIRLIVPLKINISAPITIPMNIQTNQSIGDYTSVSTMSVSQILTIIWIIGMIFFSAYQIFCYISFKRLVRRWEQNINDESILKAFYKAKEFSEVKRDIQIKICKAVKTPIVFGLIKPTLYLPDTQFNDDDLPIILRHELVHFRRNDIWYKLLLVAAKTIHWFNPIVYLMFKAADKDIELACDAEVVKNKDFDYRRQYCEAILRLVHNGYSRKTALSTCFIFSKKTVLERFKNILDQKIKKNGIIMFCIVAISIILSGSIITFAAEQVAHEIEENLQIIERPTPKPEPTEDPPQIPTQSPVQYEQADKNIAIYTEKPTQPVVIENSNTYDTYDYSYTAPAENNDAEAADEPVPTTDTETNDDINVSIGENRNSVYEELGQPDSVSTDGSKEVYNLSDGNTAVLQYEDDTLEDGYILIE